MINSIKFRKIWGVVLVTERISVAVLVILNIRRIKGVEALYARTNGLY